MLILLVTLLCFVGVQLHAERCKTPDGKNGNCVSIYNCQEILDLLVALNATQIKYIQQFQCGYEKNPLVCCPSKQQVEAKVDEDLFNKRYCGYQHADDYYNKNPNKANIDEFPWLASLLFKIENKIRGLCGGALINERYVLTAAHCTMSPQNTLVGVRLGEYNIDSEKDCTDHSEIEDCTEPTIEYGIEQIIRHPDYSLRNKTNDIALLKLNTTVSYSDFIRPICLPFPGINLAKTGDVLITSGWGYKSFGGEPVSVKKKVFLELVLLEECRSLYSARSTRVNITEKHTCTRAKSTTLDISCQGDSGGPVMFSNKNQWHIEGIVSFGAECGTQFPDVNTNVVFYLNWILDNIRSKN